MKWRAYSVDGSFHNTFARTIGHALISFRNFDPALQIVTDNLWMEISGDAVRRYLHQRPGKSLWMGPVEIHAKTLMSIGELLPSFGGTVLFECNTHQVRVLEE